MLSFLILIYGMCFSVYLDILCVHVSLLETHLECSAFPKTWFGTIGQLQLSILLKKSPFPS